MTPKQFWSVLQKGGREVGIFKSDFIYQSTFSRWDTRSLNERYDRGLYNNMELTEKNGRRNSMVTYYSAGSITIFRNITASNRIKLTTVFGPTNPAQNSPFFDLRIEAKPTFLIVILDLKNTNMRRHFWCPITWNISKSNFSLW